MKVKGPIKFLFSMGELDEFEKFTFKQAPSEQGSDWSDSGLRKPPIINYPCDEPEGTPDLVICDGREFTEVSRTPYPGVPFMGEMLVTYSNAFFTKTQPIKSDLSAVPETNNNNNNNNALHSK